MQNMQKGSRNLPEIRINFSTLLYRGECRRLDLFLNKGQSKIASPDRYEAKAAKRGQSMKRCCFGE